MAMASRYNLQDLPEPYTAINYKTYFINYLIKRSFIALYFLMCDSPFGSTSVTTEPGIAAGACEDKE